MDILQSLKDWQERRQIERDLRHRFMTFWAEGGLNLIETLERLTLALERKAAPPEPDALCYYCQQRRPVSQMETIGKYDYCLEHGRARQARLLKEESNGH